MTSKVVIKVFGDVSIGGVPPGNTIELNADSDGNPLSEFWRRRLLEEVEFMPNVVKIMSYDPGASPDPHTVFQTAAIQYVFSGFSSDYNTIEKIVAAIKQSSFISNQLVP